MIKNLSKTFDFEIANLYYRTMLHLFTILFILFVFYLTTLVIEIISHIILVRFIIKHCIYKNQTQLYFFF